MKSNMGKKLLHTAVALMVLVLYLFPLYWQFITSLKSNIEVFRNPPTFWPAAAQWENYRAIFSDTKVSVFVSFFNSLLIAGGTTAFSLLVATPAAYALAKFRIRLASVFLFLFIIGQMLSPTVKLVPLFIMFRDMKIIGNPVSVIIALSTYTVPFAVLILRPFFLSIPISITESAMIDGCNKLTAFSRIMLPISYPGITVVLIFNFLTGWNDLVYPYTFLTRTADRPMIANMYQYMSEYSTQWNSLMTFSVVSVLPIILFFFILQRYIVGGITLGAVKG